LPPGFRHKTLYVSRYRHHIKFFLGNFIPGTIRVRGVIDS
jgi:hypothetical protein